MLLARSALTVFLSVLTVLTFISSPVFSRVSTEEDALSTLRMMFESTEPVDDGRPILNGRKYTYGGLIQDFLATAFSDTLWLANTEEPSMFFLALNKIWPSLRPMPDEQRWYSVYKGGLWLDKFIKPEKGYPKLGMLNRWPSGEVYVGLGWPSAMGKMMTAATADTSPEAIAMFTSTIEPILADIRKKTGINITFMPPRHPQEATSHFARIRIVPVTTTGFHNKYKSYIADTGHGRHRPLEPLGLLLGGVEFTPFTRAQVDGFFLPESDNSIGFAACRIGTKLSGDMVAALVAECLLRALGLPSLVPPPSTAPFMPRRQAPAPSFLGNWNAGEDGVSKTLFADGEAALDSTINPIPLKWGSEKVPAFLQSFVKNREITDYDAALLSMLYCDVLKPGMDKNAVAISLFKHKNCWKSKALEPNKK